MLLFPAIDIRDGKCVRLVKGDFNRETVFADRPADMVCRWQNEGAEYLHVVDLDCARAGKPVNLAALKEILQAAHVPVQLGGGIRDLATIRTLLELGVSRVILGSIAVKNPLLVKEALARFGEQIVVGIDAQAGIVAVEGWGQSSHITADSLALQMAACGVKRIIYTDISRDGTLAGVNVEGTVRLARAAGIKVIASGGVKNLADIEALLACGEDKVEGVIMGKSIYTGALDLKQALKLVKQGS